MPEGAVKDEAAWERAKKAAKKQNPKDFYALAQHIYQKMIGKSLTKSDLLYSMDGRSWIDRFNGTPFYSDAIAIERESIESMDGPVMSASQMERYGEKKRTMMVRYLKWKEDQERESESREKKYEAAESARRKILAEKSFVIPLIKASGEGSRGGKVIGHTSSGKPIYDAGHTKTMGKEHLRDWTEADHMDAASHHFDAARSKREKALKMTGSSEASDTKRRKLLSDADAHGEAGGKHAAWSKTAYRERSDYDRYLRTTKSLDGNAYFIKAGTGEGSRGGRIIGHTPSGKPIYDAKTAKEMHHHEFEGWSEMDHVHASLHHFGEAKKLKEKASATRGDSEKSKRKRAELRSQASEHESAAITHSTSGAVVATRDAYARAMKQAHGTDKSLVPNENDQEKTMSASNLEEWLAKAEGDGSKKKNKVKTGEPPSTVPTGEPPHKMETEAVKSETPAAPTQTPNATRYWTQRDGLVLYSNATDNIVAKSIKQHGFGHDILPRIDPMGLIHKSAACPSCSTMTPVFLATCGHCGVDVQRAHFMKSLAKATAKVG